MIAYKVALILCTSLLVVTYDWSLSTLHAIVYKNQGFCPSYDSTTMFIAHNSWFRDHYLCSKCNSIPRERALMFVLKKIYPNYKHLSIHESSPAFRSTSLYLKNHCQHYSYSYYDSHYGKGQYLERYNCTNQDLGNITFKDNSFDIVITQDVMEHIFELRKVLQEIGRILKVNGSHIFTTPLVNKNLATVVRAHLEQNKVVYDKEPIYHGNPIDASGSLVTYDFGYDITQFIPSNCYLTIYFIENKYFGLEKAEHNEVCVMTRFKE